MPDGSVFGARRSVVGLGDRPVRVSEETGILLDLILDDRRSTLVGVDPSDEDLEFQTNYLWPDEDVRMQALDLLAPYKKEVGEDERPAVEPSRYFGQQGRFLVTELMADAEYKTRIKRGIDDRLWRYHRGVYLPDGEELVRGRCHGLLADRYNPSSVTKVVHGFRDREARVESRLPEKPSTEWINFLNGQVAWRSGETRRYDPTRATMVQLPVVYDVAAECPKIDRFLADVLPEDAVAFFHEVLGYFMYAGNPLQQAFLLLGSGNNGKSRALSLMRAMLGDRNCTSIPLEQLSGDRNFMAAHLYGKLANVCGDISSNTVRSAGLFKQLTGEDMIMAEHKGRDAFQFRWWGKPIFSGNEAPQSRDQTKAYFRRWIIIPFPRTFVAGVDEDPHVLDGLTSEAELSGLANRALAGLSRLMTRGRFEIPLSVDEAGQQHRHLVDSVAAFLRDESALDPSESWRTAEIYMSYRGWCEDNGMHPLSAAQVHQHMLALHPGELTEHGKGRHRKLIGLRKREPRDDE